MITPSDAAEGCVIAVIAVCDMPCDVGSPPPRAEERPVHSAVDENAKCYSALEVQHAERGSQCTPSLKGTLSGNN